MKKIRRFIFFTNIRS